MLAKPFTSRLNTSTYPKSIFCINLLVILSCQHVTEMADRRVMHDGDFVPPVGLGAVGRATGVRQC